MSMITIRNLQFQYDAAPEINALYGIDLEIHKGECIILTGECGCGKTTLTRCLLLLRLFWELLSIIA